MFHYPKQRYVRKICSNILIWLNSYPEWKWPRDAALTVFIMFFTGCCMLPRQGMLTVMACTAWATYQASGTVRELSIRGYQGG